VLKAQTIWNRSRSTRVPRARMRTWAVKDRTFDLGIERSGGQFRSGSVCLGSSRLPASQRDSTSVVLGGPGCPRLTPRSAVVRVVESIRRLTRRSRFLGCGGYRLPGVTASPSSHVSSISTTNGLPSVRSSAKRVCASGACSATIGP
jgi:hypothetical protein